jgi:hypothetical protein
LNLSVEETKIPGARSTQDRSDRRSDRPFYFNLVLWGERYRHYFLDYCLPSLLSPRNIPALSRKRGNKFLIATHAQDWAILSAAPIMARLREYAEPVFIELPSSPPGGPQTNYNELGYNLALMGAGHQRISTMALRDRAYGVYLSPDSMLSDGSVERLQAHAESGVELVLCTALRLGEEPLVESLAAQGLIPVASRAQSGMPLTISGRQMVAAAAQGMHSETQTYEWNACYFLARHPSAAWWRVPGETGVLIHSLNWMPLLFDFAAVAEHDASSLESWTLDGDYVYKNLGASHSIHIVQDSDEMFMASWAPVADRPRKLVAASRPWPGILERWRQKMVETRKGVDFHDGFYDGFFDPLKQQIFFLPVWWHADDLNESWAQTEREAQKVLRRWVLPPESEPGKNPSRWRESTFIFVIVPLRIAANAQHLWTYREFVYRRFGEMLRGDRRAWNRAIKRLRDTLRHIST